MSWRWASRGSEWSRSIACERWNTRRIGSPRRMRKRGDSEIELIDSLRPGPRTKQSPLSPALFRSLPGRGPVEFPRRSLLGILTKIGRFVPAIFSVLMCTDRPIPSQHSFIAPTGGPGFRICPYDGEQFFQDRPNQDYCCPAHREAHRVARFRNGKNGEDSKSN